MRSDGCYRERFRRRELLTASFKHSIKGSVEKYLENAAEGDPLLAGLDAAGLRFREVYQMLGRACSARQSR